MAARNPFKRRRQVHLRLGQRGERIAAHLLRELGLTVLTRNYRDRQYEIDIVARDRNTLCFVEVKTRRRLVRTRPGAAVGPAKRKNIVKAARRYLREIGFPAIPHRFDLVEVILQGRRLRAINYLPAAFTEQSVKPRLDEMFPDLPANYVRRVVEPSGQTE